jgi:hypothetical protein
MVISASSACPQLRWPQAEQKLGMSYQGKGLPACRRVPKSWRCVVCNQWQLALIGIATFNVCVRACVLVRTCVGMCVAVLSSCSIAAVIALA